MLPLLSHSASSVDDPRFAHAIQLALRARGRTAPNPLVGCVVVRDGAIVGEGYHPRAGEPHAEVFALAQAGERARGADVYVTLEPCSHHGRTPPCVDALVAAGVARVFIGMRDPSPLAGGGAQALRAAGIEVVFAEDPAPFAALNEGWLKRQATGLPAITAKVALSLDGRPAFSAGERAAITGASGARITQQLREASDAVLVGAATVIADDPALTRRRADNTLAEEQPLRVVLVASHVPEPDARVFTDGAAPTLVLAPDGGEDAVEAALTHLPSDVLVRRYPVADGLPGALRLLGERGVNELLVEPGPKLFTALWQAGALDALVTVVAGGCAGADAPSLFGGVPDRAEDALVRRMRPAETGIVGDVAVTVWRPQDADQT